MPQGIKPSPEASISSGVAHFRMTHLTRREVVMYAKMKFCYWVLHSLTMTKLTPVSANDINDAKTLQTELTGMSLTT